MRGRSERENTGVRVFGYETMMCLFIVKTGDELRRGVVPKALLEERNKGYLNPNTGISALNVKDLNRNLKFIW